MKPKEPKLKQVSKVKQIYPLNCFPEDFGEQLAAHICAHLAVRPDSDLEGKDWERIFAKCINADWTPSNIGLDDVTSTKFSIAWGAKTVKKSKILETTAALKLAKPEVVRLISGRNSPDFSYAETVDPKSTDPNVAGEMVLSIWNKRVEEIFAKHKELRTVVLVKGKDLLTLNIFEYETVRYIPEDYLWLWNKNLNLEGFDKNKNHKFTWQPHGSQFTVLQEIPPLSLRLRIRKPNEISFDEVLKQISFDKTFFKKI